MTMKIVMKAPYDQNTDHSWLFSGHDHQIAKTRDSSNVQALLPREADIKSIITISYQSIRPPNA
jgi:hypothetical protein